MSTMTLTDDATTVAKMYQAFGQGDIPFILAQVANDCEWIGAGGDLLPAGGTYIGKDAAKFFVRLAESGDFNSFNVISVNNINEQEVVAFGNMSLTAKATGKKMSSEWVMHWKFNKEGKAIYFHDFYDTAAAYLALQP